MTITCPACTQPLYPRLARRSDQGWVCADGRACHRARRNAERREDLAWMADTGEDAEGAARRLGLSHDALEKWCARNARDLWAQLVGNRKERAA